MVSRSLKKIHRCHWRNSARDCQGSPDGQGLLPIFTGIPRLSSNDPDGSERFQREPVLRRDWKGIWYLSYGLRGSNPGGHTVSSDIDPFLTSRMYLMISFMGILSMENKWKLVIEAEGFSYGHFAVVFPFHHSCLSLPVRNMPQNGCRRFRIIWILDRAWHREEN